MDQWRAYTHKVGRQKDRPRTWIGDVPGLVQYHKNAFFVDDRVAKAQQGAVVVVFGAGQQPAPTQAPSSATSTRPPRAGCTVACTVDWPAANIATLRAKSVATALEERTRWNNGNLKGSDRAAFDRLVEFWHIGVGFTNSHAKAVVKEGKYAWSAAFISWVMRVAGAGGDFCYAKDHGTYIAAAYQNRRMNNCSPFKAYPVNEIAPQPGDILCTTYQRVPTDLKRVRPSTSGYHCDIVVGIAPGQLTTLGGNLSNSVGRRFVKVDANGLVTNPRYFAVIKVG
jgi:hypothetical protein